MTQWVYKEILVIIISPKLKQFYLNHQSILKLLKRLSYLVTTKGMNGDGCNVIKQLEMTNEQVKNAIHLWA
jgi:hypothetical protein